VWRAAFAAAVAAQCLLLYWPRTPSVATGLPLDKVVHFTIFAVVAALGLRAGFRSTVIVALLLCQAVLSELVQGFVLPQRGGDPADFAADALGIATGVAFGRWWVRRRLDDAVGPIG
jgi:hypothetical protein